MSTPGLRREPRQGRSRARVAQIVSAAERLIVDEGVSALNMRRLAEVAGVPVGSVYQFFADREAVLAVIVAQHGVGQSRMREDALRHVGSRPWQELVDDMLELQCARLREDPAYVAIWVARALSVDEQQRDDEDVESIAGLLADLLVSEEGVPPSQTLTTRCRVAVQAADALLHLAFRLHAQGHAETIAQAKTMLRLYLRQVVAEARVP
jgi:AcrR family transcriptional regulator